VVVGQTICIALYKVGFSHRAIWQASVPSGRGRAGLRLDPNVRDGSSTLMLRLSISRLLFLTKADADRASAECTVGQGPRSHAARRGYRPATPVCRSASIATARG